ncbi:hypothetical protein [Rhizobium sp. A37_96]
MPTGKKCTVTVIAKAFLADKAYGGDALIDYRDKRQIKPMIPLKANRTQPRHTDFALCCERSLIDILLSNIKSIKIYRHQIRQARKHLPCRCSVRRLS